MKIRTYFFAIIATIVIVAVWPKRASAQQYKFRQVTTMMNLKSETTVYVKGMRKRTEGGGYAGMANNVYSIEQCDLQRTISINPTKKLYYIEPFSKQEATAYQDEKSSLKTKPVATSAGSSSQKGGIVTMWYNITDTGERKKMYGMTARHVWTTQKIKPSTDACMKDSMLMKTDGWYIDLPEFTCPVRYTASYAGGPSVAAGCQDKYITKQTGRGKLGFPLIEKRTMIMGDGKSQTNTFETTLETIEFSTAKLDSMLFEIPEGYTLTQDINHLYEPVSTATVADYYGKSKNDGDTKAILGSRSKGWGIMRIAVMEPGTTEQLSTSELQLYIVNALESNNIEAVAVTSLEHAKEKNCDLILRSNINRVKQASRVGGILKAVRNIDPNAASAYNIEAQFILSNLKDGSTQSEKNVAGKFEGTYTGALKKAMLEGAEIITEEIRN